MSTTVQQQLESAAVSDADVEFFDEDDDDEFDLDAARAQQPILLAELKKISRTSRFDPKSTTKAQAIFDQMFEAYIRSEDSALCPDIEVYNYLIETHTYALNENSAEEAERILSKMEEGDGTLVASPNLETYTHVVDAWAMRRNPEKAMEIVERLRARWESEGKPDELEPNAGVYNKLIKANGMAERYDEANDIFRMLLDSEGEMKANYKSWVQIMKALGAGPDGTEKVRSLMQEMRKAYRMGDDDYLPRTDVYNALIRSFAGQKEAALDAEAMLYEMLAQYREGNDDMMPNSDTFMSTVLAFKKHNDAGASAKVETLIQIHEGLYQQTGGKDESLRPTLRLLNTVLGVIAASKDNKKATRAKRIFDKIKKYCDEPDSLSFYFLLKACANTRASGDEEFKMKTFQIAVDALKEARDVFGSDSACFGMFIRACGNLMPLNRKRDNLIKSIFTRGCADGIVNDFLLNEFVRASSEELQLAILGGFLEDGVRIPEEWGRNAS